MLIRPGNQSFTLIELMCVIAIMAALIIAALFFIGPCITWAQQTSNSRVLATLNSALTEYQTSGGMTQSHSLQGVNNSAEVAAVVSALQTGFTFGGQRRSFLQPGANIDPTQLYAAGQSQQFHFTGYGTGAGMVGTGGDGIEGQIEATLSADNITPVAGLGTWINTAQAADGGTNNFLLLTQPSSSQAIAFNVEGTGTLSVNWGDGSTNTYTLTSSSQNFSHTYGSAANYGVVLIGNVSYFSASGSNCAFGGNISTMTGLTYLNIQGSNTLSGSVSGLTGLTYLAVTGSNTLSGSVTGLTGLTTFSVYGSNTFSGSIAGLTGLTYLNVGGSNTLTGWETAAANCTGLCYMYQRGSTVLTSTQVNAVLAGFRANTSVTKSSSSQRTINVANAGNGSPTGQGITDKAYLQSCVTPPGSTVWTVTTN